VEADAVEIRPVHAHEAEQLRALRLATMADAPYAFASSYKRELERPAEFWERLARQTDEGVSGATFVAVDGDRWIGLAGVFVDAADPGCGYVWGTWVAPDTRGSGVGRGLVQAVRNWAIHKRLERLRLSVSDSPQSEPARRLYEAIGFKATGEYEPMTSDSTLRAHEMTLSLERHPSLDDRFDPAVRIVEYDAAWPVLAESELRRIKDALGGPAPRLEHVGSTAVPGLAAKPIIDLQLSVDSLEPRHRYAEPLQALGYLFVPTPESPDYHFFAKPAERPRTHHLHVCEVQSEHEFRHLAVRDFLRAHVAEAERYAELKRELVLGGPQDRLAYIAGKEAYVAALEARATAWARSRDEAQSSAS
jgi:GrpB-like predicted nucleotidyltransferase (UPF0157 family)/GNAT superfamily N-acetyltransferase